VQGIKRNKSVMYYNCLEELNMHSSNDLISNIANNSNSKC